MNIIKSDAGLADFVESIRHEKELAIDTEFKRTSTYNPILCLIQIATKSKAACIDAISIKNLVPLFEKLYQDDTLWIVHSARQDIEALYCLSNKIPKQLFDTQIAASLLNFPIQISYQELTAELLDVHLEKAYTRLDWTTRPLPIKAIEYALDDVIYLIKNYYKLNDQLAIENKVEWVKEDSKELLNSSLYEMPIDQAWKKVKGIFRLPKQAQNKVAALSAFREYKAKNKNKPRKWILSDDQLIRCALGREKLSQNNEKQFKSFITNHPEINNVIIPVKQSKPPTEIEKQQKIQLQKLIKQKATKYNLPLEVIATNKSLLKYIRGDNSVSFCKGWRYKLLKKELEC